MFLKKTVHFLGKHWIFRAAFPRPLPTNTYISHLQFPEASQSLPQKPSPNFDYLSNQCPRFHDLHQSLPPARRKQEGTCAVCATLTSPCHLAYQGTWRGTCCYKQQVRNTSHDFTNVVFSGYDPITTWPGRYQGQLVSIAQHLTGLLLLPIHPSSRVYTFKQHFH